ncbi:MAG: hypothetical protein DMG11_02390 [Acidobacteria bacterium]|nr:MAG: hypothetical protein DMG11_02390 [Acidobacteriota bacterium]
MRVGWGLWRRWTAGRRLGIEETIRLGQAPDELHVSDSGPGILKARLESDAGIGRCRGSLLRASLGNEHEQDGGETQKPGGGGFHF